jgi:hypothetical protein
MTRTSQQPSRIVRDQRGAVLVMGVFATAMLIGMLYYLFGTADAIRYREHMQDSADAGAWSMAVMGARGMNLVALLNMAKLSAVACLIGLAAALYGAVETLDWINRSRFRRIIYAPSKIVLKILIPILVAKLASVEPKVNEITKAANDAQEALGRELLAVAETRANDLVVDGFGKPTEAVFTEAGRQMPLKDGSTTDFCIRVSKYSDPPGYNDLVPAEYYSVFQPAKAILEKIADELPQSTPRRKMISEGEDKIEPYCIARGVTAKEPTEKLGNDVFSVRAYATGGEVPTWHEDYIRIATAGRDEDGGKVKELRDRAGRLAWAQAEYYFDGKEKLPDQLLWHMAWRARMRRFRDVDVGGFQSGCSKAGGGADCGRLAQDVQQLEKASAH